MVPIRGVFALVLCLICVAGLAGAGAQRPGLTPVAPMGDFTVVARYPHDVTAFTEGLVYIDGQLYEGTGLEQQSQLRLVDLASGTVLESHTLSDTSEFGEGIVVLGDTIYQLTWQSQIAHVYDRDTFEQTGTFTYEGQGWGLTTDGTSLIMSNGSDKIVYRDPATFEVTRTISVVDGDQPIADLNELEYIDGVIWANVWRTNLIARIDPQTGEVIDWLDLSALDAEVTATNPNVDVLNGIAWNPETGTVFVTGKFWPTLFEIDLAPK
ncbi:MAG TPA: glutaminyl-peptide cyclotransferase [Thermomicrobiales bacterium]|nr:glutaminyl-peptide cyclotransferase [Thermomicrobiales bacterium]